MSWSPEQIACVEGARFAPSTIGYEREDVERLRHSATSGLLSRRDVVVVSSVSCIYGLGTPQEYVDRMVRLTVGEDFASFSCDFQNLTFCGAQPGNLVLDIDPRQTSQLGVAQAPPAEADATPSTTTSTSSAQEVSASLAGERTSTATSSRRRPGVRRRTPSGNPTSRGTRAARRRRRKSASSARSIR